MPLVAALALAFTASGCGWFGNDDSSGSSASVFSVKPGQCFRAPEKVKAELASLTRTECTQPHTQEAYAIIGYTGPSTSTATSSAAYPGNDVLTKFAQGACAQRFRDYVGIDYLDSSLYFTYLLPSARGWEQGRDRNVICFVTTTGSQLTASVKGSEK